MTPPLLRQYTIFLIVGGTGVCLNLGTIWVLTHYLIGLENYFLAYLIGTAINLAYLFTLHTIQTFRTTHDHGKRLVLFVGYHLAMTAIQASIIKTITPLVGLEYYLFVIGAVIGGFSIVTFLVFRFKLFTRGPLKLATIFKFTSNHEVT